MQFIFSRLYSNTNNVPLLMMMRFKMAVITWKEKNSKRIKWEKEICHNIRCKWCLVGCESLTYSYFFFFFLFFYSRLLKVNVSNELKSIFWVTLTVICISKDFFFFHTVKCKDQIYCWIYLLWWFFVLLEVSFLSWHILYVDSLIHFPL